MTTSPQMFKKKILLSDKSCLVISEVFCVKLGKEPLGLMSSFTANKLTSGSIDMEGDKDMILERAYKAQ